jgi:hypothetical protein
VLTVVLVVLAVVGAILLFTVVKPDPDASPSAVVKTLLTDFRDGKDVDKWRCAAERTSQPHSAGVAKELGVGPTDITSYSVQDKGKVRRVSDGKEGTAVAVTLQTRAAGPKSFDLFVLEENGHDRVCGIGSLT